MTPDPVDAALDVWFGDRDWREEHPTLVHPDDWRARMRRVLDAHDAARDAPKVQVWGEGRGQIPVKLSNYRDPPPEPDPNTLPMDALPEGVVFSTLVFFEDIELWRVTLMSPIGVPDCVPLYSVGEGPTPRAAMLAAIEATKEGK